MTICDGMALLIIVQNDDDARRYGSLVTPRHYVINDDLGRHFSLIFSNSLMMPPLLCMRVFLNINSPEWAVSFSDNIRSVFESIIYFICYNYC